MKLKYYLRGLGTGILVTALILGISNAASGDKVMSDEEVLARAKQLGWSESTVLSEMTKVNEEDAQEDIDAVKDVDVATDTSATNEAIQENETEIIEAEAAETSEPEVNESEVSEPEVSKTEVSESEVSEPEVNDTEEDGDVEDVTEPDVSMIGDNKNSEEFGMPDEAGTIVITIVRGDSSDSVSRKLEEAGLVDSATAYDKYLCQNGYDKSIRTGNFEIPADATGEEIAKLITGR